MMKNNNTLNNSLFTKVLASLMVFVFAVGHAFAVPSTLATNLQTTAGVTVTGAGNSLSIVAPNKSVLTWQNFGSGADSIAAGDVLTYTLPSRTSSVLNIVAGGNSTTVDGSIASNGNVFVLNPNGIVVGNGARIDVNRLTLSTSDNPNFASYYFQQNGVLPSQDGLSTLSGATTINNGAIVSTTEHLNVISKNITVGGVLSQGNLILTADGAVSVGSAGMAYISGDLTINNLSGATIIGSVGNSTIVTNNITVNGNSTSTFGTIGGGTIQTKALNVIGGNIVSDRVSTNNLTLNGTNVSVNVGANAGTPNLTLTGNGTIAVTAPSSLNLTLTNTGAGATTVAAGGNLTLNKIQVEGSAGAAFSGASIVDTSSRIFVYGPALFSATAGNITINKGNHSFGPVSILATGEAVVVEDATTNLNIVSTPKLTLRSTDAVFQTASTGVINSPLVSVTAANNIALGALANSAGNYTVSGKDVVLTNNGTLTLATTATGNATAISTGNITLAETSVNGTFGVTTTGTISQAVDTKIHAVGATSFVGTGLNVSNSGNGFGALTIDVGAGGSATITEETTLNLASLRAASAIVKSTNNVITTGTLPVAADTFNVISGGDFIPAANFRAVNAVTVLSTGNVDLTALSLATNLNSKTPSVIARGYKAPTP